MKPAYLYFISAYSYFYFTIKNYNSSLIQLMYNDKEKLKSAVDRIDEALRYTRSNWHCPTIDSQTSLEKAKNLFNSRSRLGSKRRNLPGKACQQPKFM